MAYDSVLPFDTSSKALAFVSETLTADHELIEDEGISGTRSLHKERVTQGLIVVAGQVTLTPSPTELDFLLPLILGTAESVDSFVLAETLPEFQLMIDRVAKVFSYTDLKVGKATFRGSKGQKISLILDLIGKTEVEAAAGSFPAITIDTDAMYVFHHAASGLTLEGTGSRKFNEFELVIDNMLVAEANNSQTADYIDAQGRLITLSLSSPYEASQTDLYTTPKAGAAGAAASLVFTNGNQALTFTFANLKALAKSPTVPGKSEIRLPLSYRAYMSGATKELVVTHDSTA